MALLLAYPIVCLLVGTVSGQASWAREAALHALVIAAIVFTLRRAWRNERWPLVGGLFEPAVSAFLLVLVVGVVGSPCAAQSWRTAALFIAAGCVFYLARVVMRRQAGRRQCLFAMAGTATAAAAIGLFGYAAGWNTRVAAPLGHHNYMAGFLLLHLPLTTSLAWHSTSVAARTTGAVCVLIQAIAIVFTGSLGAAAILPAMAIAAAWPLLGRRQRLAGVLVFVMAAIPLALTVRLSNQPLIALLRERAAGIISQRRDPSNSLENRLRYLETGAAMAAARPLAGWGAGAVPLVSARYRPQTPGLAPPGELLRQLHSVPANVAAETGIAGLLATVLIAALILGRAGQHQRRALAGDRPAHQRWFGGAGAAAVSLCAYAAFSLLDYQLDLPAIALPLAMVAALAIGDDEEREPAPVPRMTALSFLLIAACASVGLYAAAGQAHYFYGRGDSSRAARFDSLCGFYLQQAGRPIEAAVLMPDVPAAAAQAGCALAEAGQWTRSVDWLKRAADLDHYNSLAHFHLGRARLRTGDREGAVEALSTSLLMQPATIFAETWLAAPERGVYLEAVERALDRMHELAAYSPAASRSEMTRRRWNELGTHLAAHRGRLPEGPYRVLFFEIIDRDLAFNHSLIAFRRAAPPQRIAPITLLLRTPQLQAPAGLGVIEGLPDYVAAAQ